MCFNLTQVRSLHGSFLNVNRPIRSVPDLHNKSWNELITGRDQDESAQIVNRLRSDGCQKAALHIVNRGRWGFILSASCSVQFTSNWYSNSHYRYSDPFYPRVKHGRKYITRNRKEGYMRDIISPGLKTLHGLLSSSHSSHVRGVALYAMGSLYLDG